VDDEVELEAHEGLLSFERRRRDGRVLVVTLNVSDEPAVLERQGEVVLSVNEPAGERLGPWCARVLAVDEAA
jgi:hypothetical protein